jgi:hypothetical protein
MGNPKIFEFDKPIKIVLGAFGIIFVLFFALTPAINRWAYRATRANSGCHSRLINLNSALVEYAAKHEGRLPPADGWCDEIKTYLPRANGNVENFYRCPSDASKDKGLASYAMNARLSNTLLSQLPKDTVLLFESKPGWNRSGGPADMSFENHHYWEDAIRCGVLFADGQAWCIDKKNPPPLRWEP